MVMVDSSIFIDFLNNKINLGTEKFDELLITGDVCIADYILVEVLQGIRNDNQFEKTKQMMNAFECFSLLNKELAVLSAKNYRFLRKKGITIRKTVDIIIGTFCIENDLKLLHNDKDFEPLEKYLGLKVII